MDAEEAAHLMDNLDWMGAVEDISSAADTLAADGNGEVAVVGFCMGGALSLASAALVEEIDCAIAFYGIPPSELADMTTLAKPVQGHFGNQDSMDGFSCAAAVDAREPPAPLWPPAAPPWPSHECIFAASCRSPAELTGRADLSVEEALSKAGSPHEIHRYEGVGHAFMNDTEGERRQRPLPAWSRPALIRSACHHHRRVDRTEGRARANRRREWGCP